MRYTVTKTHNNGYRCCCHTSWDSVKHVDTWDMDVASLPDVLKHCTANDMEAITVFDHNINKTIVELFARWGTTRGTQYRHTRWHGHVNDVPVDIVLGDDGDESWDPSKAGNP